MGVALDWCPRELRVIRIWLTTPTFIISTRQTTPIPAGQSWRTFRRILYGANVSSSAMAGVSDSGGRIGLI